MKKLSSFQGLLLFALIAPFEAFSQGYIEDLDTGNFLSIACPGTTFRVYDLEDCPVVSTTTATATVVDPVPNLLIKTFSVGGAISTRKFSHCTESVDASGAKRVSKKVYTASRIPGTNRIRIHFHDPVYNIGSTPMVNADQLNCAGKAGFRVSSTSLLEQDGVSATDSSIVLEKQTFKKFFITPLTTVMTSEFNRLKICGLGNWAVGQSKEILGPNVKRDCSNLGWTFADVGSHFFGIAKKLSNGDVVSGDSTAPYDGLSRATRPIRLNHNQVFIRK